MLAMFIVDFLILPRKLLTTSQRLEPANQKDSRRQILSLSTKSETQLTSSALHADCKTGHAFKQGNCSKGYYGKIPQQAVHELCVSIIHV